MSISKINLLNKRITAGTVLSDVQELIDFPAPAYAVEITLRYRNTAPITFLSANENGSHKFNYSLASAIPNGTYSYLVRIKDTALNTFEFYESGIVPVYPDLTNAAVDGRTKWQIIYENYLDAYTRLSSKEVDQVTIMGDTVTYINRSQLPTLIKLMNHAKLQMEIEQGVKKRPNQIYKAWFR